MESVEDEVAAGFLVQPPNVVTSTLALIITKLPLLMAELQKCHYWQQNYKNATTGPQMLAHLLG